MNRMEILGVGILSMGNDAPFAHRTAMLDTLPIKAHVPPRVSRRYGRLTKMVTVAAHRAFEQAGIDDPTGIPVVSATCIGETKAALGILEQIYQSRGARISPALVPNSVHNAAAGYLLIATKNRAPSITVSQGWLSSEAALVAAMDMLSMTKADRVLVVSGDEADPAWVDRLNELGATALADALDNAAFQEGATAWILGKQGTPGSKGQITAAVERCTISPDNILAVLDKHNIHPSNTADIVLRRNCGGQSLVAPAAEAFKRPMSQLSVDGIGPGTVQSAPLLALANRVNDPQQNELLMLSHESEELGFIHFEKEK